MRLLVGLLVALGLLAGCGSDTDPGGSGGGASDAGSASSGTSGTAIEIDGDPALRWGDGPYGVVLAHGAAFDAASWADEATAIAEQGATVVAVESLETDAIAAAVGYLQDEGTAAVALVGGSAGADAILDLSSEQPELADQLITLSANGVVDGLGTQPKLFIASEDEPGAADVARELAETAPGEDNQVQVVPGSAHAQNLFDSDQADVVLDAVLERLDQR